jgi:uroporphyrinogen decarboxylase
MTARERFRKLLHYESVDRLPVLALEPFESTARERWQGEGLPRGVDPVDFLGMSRLVHLPLSWGPVPAFEERLVAEDAVSITTVNWLGATVRAMKENPSMFYGHLDHPVKNGRDWDAYRGRLLGATPSRLPADWESVVVPRLNAAPDPVGICLFPCFFRFCFYAMGMERFLTAFYDDPGLMHDIFGQLSTLMCDVLRRALGQVQVDYALFAEDLAGKNGPLISPRLYAEFWDPHQDPILALLREHQVPLVCQWTAGQCEVLLPGMLAHGFNCTWPLEVVAGMDAPGLRRRFGRDLRLGGNIAKEAVIAGPAAIDRELERLLPLIHAGGFLPALDDMASPDMPFAHYRYLIERLQGIRL